MIARIPSFLPALGLCGALALWASPSAADLVPSLSVQTGVTVTRSPGNDSNDYFVAATPTLSYFVEFERSLISLTYSFTGSLNSFLPNGVANRLALATVHDLAPKTRLILGAEALQALIGNYLLVRRSASTQVGALPPLNTSLLSVGFTQGISHDFSPVVRLTQGVTGTYVTSLDPDIQLRNYLAAATVGVDRSWEFDAVGAELTTQYARTFFPPLPTLQVVTAALGPTWDHDVSPTISTSLSVAAQVAVSPDPGTSARIGPSGRASALYSSEGSGIGLDLTVGIEPNLLLGTLFQSQQATLRGFTPISEKNNVVLGVSGGYLRAKVLDLRTMGALDNSFDAVLHDADITWAAADFLSLFVRYQFIGQTAGDGAGGGATPALVRHGAIVGVELFASRPTARARLPAGRFPQRVDRSDAQQLGRTPTPAGGSSSSQQPR